MKYALLLVCFSLGCAEAEGQNGAHGGDDDANGDDSLVDASETSADSDPITDSMDAGATPDSSPSIDSAAMDTGSALDSSVMDTGSAIDTGSVVDSGSVVDTAPVDTGPSGPITGGPCVSTAAGATAFRLKFTNSSGHAMTNYEVTGLPDKTGFKAAAYKTGSIDPSWYPPFEGSPGGLRLDSSDFLDINFSTAGISSITSVTIAIYGRSLSSTGSFSWQTFEGSASIAAGTMSSSLTYSWYAASATPELATGKTDLLRIKAGPPSGAIIVNRIEVCIEAT